MKQIALLFVLGLAACTHQDLKAPYEEGIHNPVLDQWEEEKVKENHGRQTL